MGSIETEMIFLSPSFPFISFPSLAIHFHIISFPFMRCCKDEERYWRWGKIPLMDKILHHLIWMKPLFSKKNLFLHTKWIMIVVSVDIHWYRGYPECTARGTVYMKGRYASPGHWRPTKHKVCKKEQGPQPPPTTHVALATLVASNSNGSRMALVMPHILFVFLNNTKAPSCSPFRQPSDHDLIQILTASKKATRDVLNHLSSCGSKRSNVGHQGSATAVCLQFRDAKRFFVWISKGIFLDFNQQCAVSKLTKSLKLKESFFEKFKNAFKSVAPIIFKVQSMVLRSLFSKLWWCHESPPNKKDGFWRRQKEVVVSKKGGETRGDASLIYLT